MAMKNQTLLGLLLSQGAGVIIGLMAAFGLELTTVQVAAIMAAINFAGVIAVFILWARTVDRSKVVEELISDKTAMPATVVAGEANDVVPVGTTVREITAE